MSVSDLVEEFRELVDQLGSSWNLGVRPERFRQTPERDARLARIDTVTPELKRRAPAATLRALMEDDNREVRAWTARRFREVDPDFSSAALSGLVEGASTREAQRLIEHARKPPPKRPTLDKMSLDELVARFSDACLRKYWAQHCGRGGNPVDIELRNRIIRELQTISTEFGRRGARERLLPFLNSSNIAERVSAAVATLDVAPALAVRTLEEIENKRENDLEASGAGWALMFYRQRTAQKQP